MKETTSNAERKKALVVEWLRGLLRRLVTARTLIIAMQILYWIVKLVRLLVRLMGYS